MNFQPVSTVAVSWRTNTAGPIQADLSIVFLHVNVR